MTHDEAWEMAEIGEDLPFFTVFSARRGEINEDDVAWADRQIEKLNTA
jgi:hypothetical protein